MGSDCNGARRPTTWSSRVPVGTLIRDADTGRAPRRPDDAGGPGCRAPRADAAGSGNMNFATSTRQTPRFAQDGTPGRGATAPAGAEAARRRRAARFPQRRQEHAHLPRVSARGRRSPTTRSPRWCRTSGVVHYKDGTSFVIADIPGLIEGARRGRGARPPVPAARRALPGAGPPGRPLRARRGPRPGRATSTSSTASSSATARSWRRSRRSSPPTRSTCPTPAIGFRTSLQPWPRATCRCSPSPPPPAKACGRCSTRWRRCSRAARSPCSGAPSGPGGARRPEYGAMLRWSRRAPRQSLPPRLRLRRRAGGRRAEHAPVPGA